MKLSKAYTRQVFLNCPFDADYRPLFEAIIFTVLACGFVIRCSREQDDGGVTRISKITEIIQLSKFGIHDICRVELDPVNKLPRFNMPLELGLFLGAKHYSTDRKQREKCCLILDIEPYRYQKFISDIAGQDIRSHGGKPENAMGEVRGWLSTATGRPLPGQSELASVYRQFRTDLPVILADIALTEEEMQFTDYVNICSEWLEHRAPA
jgi:hypothetical protein